MSDRSLDKGLTVLVVDDHRISREYTAAALRPMAANVKQAGSADEGLKAALHDLPELVCVDLELAGESGLDLIGRLLQRWPTDTPHPRVFVLSAERPSPDRLRAAGSAVAEFLLKPVEPQRLRALLRPTSGREASAAAEVLDADPGLHRLFRQELSVRLHDLDDCVSGGNLDGAAAILHQLIASCGICGVRGLEWLMRAMLKSCLEPNTSAGLARSYYSVWSAARTHLASEGRVAAA
jgi:two-component system response regulator RegA